MQTTQNELNHYLLGELLLPKARQEALKGGVVALVEQLKPGQRHEFLKGLEIAEKQALRFFLAELPLAQSDFEDLLNQLTAED
ncbi:MAG: hypothetical protein K0B15_00985 [Lentimicrobium sp.]|nr:hypothetical protein [Lentimicrobium sp.]